MTEAEKKQQQQIERALSEIGIGALFGDAGLSMLWIDDEKRLETFRTSSGKDKPWHTREARAAKR